MIKTTRGRAGALLCTASVIALAAGLGMVPLRAQADIQTISVSRGYFVVSIDATGTATGFEILDGASVSSDETNPTPGNPAFYVDQSGIVDGIAVTDGALITEADGESALALLIEADFDGGVTNSGAITATANGGTVSATAIAVRGSNDFGGGIVNLAGAIVQATALDGSYGASKSARGIFVSDDPQFDGGVTNAGEILASAGTSGADFVPYAEAYGVLLETAPGGDISNSGTIGAYAAAALAIELEAASPDPIVQDLASNEDIEARAVGVASLGDGQSGAFENSGTISADASARHDVSIDLLSNGSFASGQVLLSGSQIGQATGVAVTHDPGLHQSTYSNSGLIDAQATAGSGAAVAAEATSIAVAVADTSGDNEASANGLVVDGEAAAVTGPIGNEAAAGINAHATASMLAHATAESAEDYAGATANLAGAADAEARGASVFLDSILGDVVNDGSIHATAVADLDAAAFAVGQANAVSQAGGESLATADALGAALIADLVDGSVLIGTSGAIIASGAAVNSATASAIATGENAVAQTAALAGEAEAEAIGYYANLELLTGDFSNAGSVVGEATAISIANATSSSLEFLAAASAESLDAQAEANGIVLVVDGLVGQLSNSSPETIAAHATALSEANASATGDTVSVVTADAALGEAGSTGLRVIVEGVVSGPVINEGAISADASASTLSRTTLEYGSGLPESATAFSFGSFATALAMSVEGGVLADGLVNEGSIVATATAKTSAELSANASAADSGSTAIATSTVSIGEASGLVLSGELLAGGFSNSGSITALGEAKTNAAVDLTAGAEIEGQVITSFSGAFGRGVVLQSHDIVGGVSNGLTGVILAEARAENTGAATGEQFAAGEGTDLSLQTRLGGVSSDAIGLQVGNKGGNEVLDGFDNAGLIGAVSTALEVASSTGTSAGEGGSEAFVSALAGGAFSYADGVLVDSLLVTGPIANSGVIYGIARGDNIAEASLGGIGEGAAAAPGSGQAVAESNSVIVEADGMEISVGSLLGEVTNSGTLIGEATANAVGTASVVSEGEAFAASIVGPMVSSVARGLHLSGGTAFVGDVTNEAEGLISASAVSGLHAGAEAIALPPGEGRAEAGVDALGYYLVATSAALELESYESPLVGDIVNAGTLNAEAAGSGLVEAYASGAANGSGIATLFGAEIGADGLRATGESLVGNTLNAGSIFADGSLDLDIDATGLGQDLIGQSYSQLADGFTASVNGIHLDAGSVVGDLTNDGFIGVGGSGDVAVTSSSAGSGEFADGTATSVRGVGEMFVTGIAIDAELYSGNILNGANGIIQSQATVTSVVGAEVIGQGTGSNAAAAAFDDGGQFLAFGMEIGVGTLTGDVTNAGSILAQATSSNSVSATATAGSFGEATAVSRGGVTGAAGMIFGGFISDGLLLGDVVNDGTITASAFGPHSATAVASGETADAEAISYQESVAFGMYASGELIVGDLLNNGSIASSATELGEVVATANSESGGSATAAGISNANAIGLGSQTSTVIGNVGNGPEATIVTTAVAGIEVAAEGGEGGYASGTAFAHGSGLLVQPGFDSFSPGASPGALLDGQLFNHGTVAAYGEASAGVSGDNPRSSDAVAITHGIGAIVEAVTGGVVNSGLVIADSRAHATLDGDGGVSSASAISYGILLVGPSPGEFGEPILQAIAPPGPTEPFATGTIGDSDGDGVAIENAGWVYAASEASASTLGEGGNAAGAYAAGLQVGRGFELDAFLGSELEVSYLGFFGGEGLVVEGDILNSGLLSATAVRGTDGAGRSSTTAVGLALYGSLVEGGVNNLDGTILAEAAGDFSYAYGILVSGSVIDGGIDNTGLIMATASGESSQADAINTEFAAGETIIDLLDGNAQNDQLTDRSIDPTFDGDNPLGIVGDIRLAHGFADTINWSGGDIQGDIYGNNDGGNQRALFSPDDVLNVFAGVSDTFDYDGDITGLYQINVNTEEHAGTAVELTLRGYSDLTSQLNVNDNGTLVIGAGHPGLVGPGQVSVETYSHADGGTLLFELTPDSEDVGIITAYSARTLIIDGGTIGIRPRFTGALYADETIYEVIYSEARLGEFDQTYSPTPLLQVAVEYGDYDGAPGEGESGPGDVHDVTDFDDDSSDVRLRVTRVAFDGVNGLTPNQRAAAGGIENVYGPDLEGSAFGDGISLLFLLSPEEYPEALSTLHGAEHAQLANLQLYIGDLFHNWLGDRLVAARSGAAQSASNVVTYAWDPLAEQLAGVGGEERNATARQTAQAGGQRPVGSASAWMTGGGLWGSADGDVANDVVGFDQDTWGIMVGADYQVDENWLIGIAGDYQQNAIDFDDGDSGDIDGFQIGLFGSYTDESGFYGDASGSLGWFDYDSSRQVAIGGLYSGTAEGETNSFVITAAAEAGYLWRQDNVLIQPLVGVDYIHASIDGFTESGADPYNLTVSDNDVSSLQSRLGFAASVEIALSDEMLLVPEVRAEWRHEFLDDSQEVTAAFAGQPGSSFTAVGSEFGRDAAVVGAGLTLQVSHSTELFVDYDGRFQSGYEAQTVSGGLKFSW